MKLIFILLCTLLIPNAYSESTEVKDVKGIKIVFNNLTIYGCPDLPETILKELDEFAKDQSISFMNFKDIKSKPTEKILAYTWSNLKESPTPDNDSLIYFSRGVTSEHLAQINKGKRVLMCSLIIPETEWGKEYKKFNELISKLAAKNDLFIYDIDSRLFYNHLEWERLRANSWQEDVPLASDSIKLHAYRTGNNGLIRIVSIGMERYGLPNLVVEEIQNSTRSLGNLINVIAQLMLEGETVKNNAFIINMDKIKHKTMRKQNLDTAYDNRKKTVEIILNNAKRDDGDPEGRLLSIDGNPHISKDPVRRLHVIASQVFGWKDDIVYVPHDDPRILAASQKAKAFAIEFIKTRFKNKLEVNEQVMIKSKFTEGEHDEYMWISVTDWKDNTIFGRLANTPHHISNLNSGDKVTIEEADIYDYIWKKDSGQRLGNETGKLITELQNKKP